MLKAEGWRQNHVYYIEFQVRRLGEKVSRETSGQQTKPLNRRIHRRSIDPEHSYNCNDRNATSIGTEPSGETTGIHELGGSKTSRGGTRLAQSFSLEASWLPFECTVAGLRATHKPKGGRPASRDSEVVDLANSRRPCGPRLR